MNNKFNQLQNQPPSFMQKDIINVSTDVIWDFYLSHNAIKKLTPPFTPMQVIKNEPLADNSITKMRIWLGPIPIAWEAKHFDFDIEEPFEYYSDSIKNTLLYGSGSEKIQFYMPLYHRTLNQQLWRKLNGYTIRYKEKTDYDRSEPYANLELLNRNNNSSTSTSYTGSSS